MQSLDNDIKSGKFKRVYLIYGEESFLVKEYENKLKESIIPAGAETMNLSVFDGKGFSGKEISEAIDTMPFFSEYRLVIVRDSGLFTTGRKDDTDLNAEYVYRILLFWFSVMRKLTRETHFIRLLRKMAMCAK